ncbi:MAG: acylphosphatase [Nanoarchaeota archaeon]|nr:acylphosphatase [Nanoarchaeota archaeon]MBU4300762.1 acylphosphatase [Nanoarchaeota archaeon]MBU4452370.1 acylphosphatase [Nanoarchaeota archaeon]MCG2723354.1 acylphosphatase [archaeon]
MQVRATIIVHGSVQGVGFRASTKAIAQDMGLKGYVQNLPNGTVKVVVEDEEETIKKLVKILKSREILGTQIVSKADVSYEDAKNEFDAFEIKR